MKDILTQWKEWNTEAGSKSSQLDLYVQLLCHVWADSVQEEAAAEPAAEEHGPQDSTAEDEAAGPNDSTAEDEAAGPNDSAAEDEAGQNDSAADEAGQNDSAAEDEAAGPNDSAVDEAGPNDSAEIEMATQPDPDAAEEVAPMEVDASEPRSANKVRRCKSSDNLGKNMYPPVPAFQADLHEYVYVMLNV